MVKLIKDGIAQVTDRQEVIARLQADGWKPEEKKASVKKQKPTVTAEPAKSN
jgi:hypothetical protein